MSEMIYKCTRCGRLKYGDDKPCYGVVECNWVLTKKLRSKDSKPEIGDIVCFKAIGPQQSTIWLIQSENVGTFYGRALGIVYPEVMSGLPGELTVLVPGDQLKALNENPNAGYHYLDDIVRLVVG